LGGGFPKILSGVIDEAAIKRALISRTRGLDNCYYAAHKANPHLHGTLNLLVEIGNAGATKRVSPQPDSEIVDAEFVRCMTGTMMSIDWGPVTKGPVLVVFPFEVVE
jgi:hypothetical protein